MDSFNGRTICLRLPVLHTGATLIGKQICAPGRVPLILAEGSVTFQTKSGSLETQLLASHAALRVRLLQANALHAASLCTCWVHGCTVHDVTQLIMCFMWAGQRQTGTQSLHCYCNGVQSAHGCYQNTGLPATHHIFQVCVVQKTHTISGECA